MMTKRDIRFDSRSSGDGCVQRTGTIKSPPPKVRATGTPTIEPGSREVARQRGVRRDASKPKTGRLALFLAVANLAAHPSLLATDLATTLTATATGHENSCPARTRASRKERTNNRVLIGNDILAGFKRSDKSRFRVDRALGAPRKFGGKSRVVRVRLQTTGFGPEDAPRRESRLRPEIGTKIHLRTGFLRVAAVVPTPARLMAWQTRPSSVGRR